MHNCSMDRPASSGYTSFAETPPWHPAAEEIAITAKSRGEATSEAGDKAGWSGRRELNPLPLPWQGSVLPMNYSRIGAGGQNRTAYASLFRAALCQ